MPSESSRANGCSRVLHSSIRASIPAVAITTEGAAVAALADANDFGPIKYVGRWDQAANAAPRR